MFDEYNELEELVPKAEVRESCHSIHEKSSIEFYKDVSKIVSTLEEHFTIPLDGPPAKYKEPNNQSAKKHGRVLWEKMLEWEKAGYCERSDKQPHCCNPMTVAEKIDLRTGKLKLRPCMDFSRHLNDYIPKQAVKLSNLPEAEKLLEDGDWQTCFDLSNMFFHVKINRNQWKFLGCEIESPEGEVIYYVFKVMIYGLKCTVHLATKLTRPIVRKAALMGIRLSIMIDDGRALGRTK